MPPDAREAVFFVGKKCPRLRLRGGGFVGGRFSLLRAFVSLEKSGQWAVFSVQCSVGSVFYSNESRAGEGGKRQNLCPPLKTNRTIYFLPQKNKLNTFFSPPFQRWATR
ncbi:MAG: hypothetical protein D6714_04230 [Bacteroidetes bacterium]|nr:MAG: hypothetical protein D6714_04230 [Bacteroidota bacterium]